MNPHLLVPHLREIVVGVACGSLIFCASLGVAAEKPPTADQLPAIAELPDPFLFQDGTRVKTPENWSGRRAELMELILTYEYGHVPPPAQVKAAPDASYVPPASSSSKGAHALPSSSPALPDGTTQTTLRLLVGPEDKASTHLIITTPPGKGPFPVIVKGDLCWGRVNPEIVREVLKHGYMLVEFDRTELAADKNDRSAGIFPLYPDEDWGDIAAWAWGFARVNDYLLTRPDVDAKRLIVTGHSRGGKAALLAGALDERVALTVPNGSGCGGAGCYRFQAPKSEDISAITRHFPYWFSPLLRQFIGKVDHLPFDQHEVRALVAPRALLTTDGLGDLWANPQGTQQSYVACKPVFDFLGAGDKIGIHFRPGPHEQNARDWAALLEFADDLFAGKKPADKFTKLQFPDLPRLFSWSAPK